jgi:hypothetical protein
MEEAKIRCANVLSPDQCGISTGVCERLTVGHGRLSFHGYWEFPCLACAKRIGANPKLAQYGVWPASEEEAKPGDPALYDEEDERWASYGDECWTDLELD